MTRVMRHLQTVHAAIPFAPRIVRGVRSEVVEVSLRATADEGEGALVLAVEWQPRPAPAAVVMHGVAGSSDDPYVVRAGRALSKRGFHVVRLNQRGSGRGSGRAGRLYHAGLADDVSVVRKFLEARDDVTAVVVLGFSLGGHVAAAARSGDAAARGKLRAIATVSSPVDLAATMSFFDEVRRTPFAFYERLMVRSLVEKAQALHPRLARAPYQLDELRGVVDLRTFDNLVTCRCHGFDGVADYHARVSVGPRLASIDIPTLMLHADDDPIVHVAPLLRAATGLNGHSSVDVVVMAGGGHVGFVEKLPELWGASAAVARAVAHFERHVR